MAGVEKLQPILLIGQSECLGRDTATTAIDGRLAIEWGFVHDINITRLITEVGQTYGTLKPKFCEIWNQTKSTAPTFIVSALAGTAMSTLADTGSGYWADQTALALWDTAATLYETALTATNNGLTKIIIIEQGQRDAQSIDSASLTKADYKAALEGFIVNIKIRFSGVKIILSMTGTLLSGDTSGFVDVRAAQSEVGAATADVFFCDTRADEYPALDFQFDELHADNFGQSLRGEELAKVAVTV